MRWCDDHCHLDDDGLGDAAVAAARAAGVERMITIGCDPDRAPVAVALAARHAGVWATVGLHPHDASLGVEAILPLLDTPGIAGIGECGLDFHYEHSPRDVQRRVFAEQIALAHERDLTLVVHTREAWAETFDVLAAEGVPARTVIHCFTGGADEARRCLDLGAFLSFSGIVTFKGAQDVRDAALLCPADRLLVETDSPYLAPVPHRGRPNTPALVPVVGARLAEVRGEAVEDVAACTWANAEVAYPVLAGAAPG